MKFDTFLSAEQAVEMGLADKVMDKRTWARLMVVGYVVGVANGKRFVDYVLMNLSIWSKDLNTIVI
jgi:hypothetical protein